MNILVLGGTGYLGFKIVNMLIQNGHTVTCIVRNESNMKKLNEIINKVKICNINNLDDHLNKNNRYDFLLNFSCKYSRNNSDEDVFEANFYNPIKVAIKSINSGINKIMTIDTGLTKTLNAYSFSKFLLSDALKWYCKQNKKLTIYNIKLENFYGDNEPSDRFIPQTITKLINNEKILLTDGTQLRDFICVKDVMDNLYNLIDQSPFDGYHDIPLGTGVGISIRELILYLKELTNSNSELCFGAIEKRKGEPNSIANIDIMNKYNIIIRYDWKTGMKKLVEKFQ